jgi:branched-chain amino acid transport system substrate-binding protein
MADQLYVSKRSERRRRAAIAVAVLVVLALAPPSAGITAQAQEKKPIKIGVVLPLSGGGAAVGNEDLQGIKYALGEVNNEIDGHKIELVVADDQNKPDSALTEARRLVESEKVIAVLGTLNSSVALALSPYLTSAKVPFIAGAIATDLTQAKKSHYTFRASFASGQFEGATADYLIRHNMKRGVLVGSDYAAGHDTVTSIGRHLNALGGTVVREMFPRQGETDYSPFLSRIADDSADFVFSFVFGGDTLRFVRQYREFGLKFPLVLSASSLSAAGMASTLGKNVEGVLSNEYWIWTVNIPESKAFVSGFTKQFGNRPETVAYIGYLEARALVEALKPLKGEVPDGEALVNALKTVSFVAPSGPWHFDADNNPVETFYMVRWDFKDGAVVPVVVDRIPDVDQYWKPKR